MRRGMVFDLDRCIGCWACAIACKMENGVPTGLWWQQVHTLDEDSGEGVMGAAGPAAGLEAGAAAPGGAGPHAPAALPGLLKGYQPTNCFHCDEPPCLPACPEDAISKRDDGIVLIDYNVCTGCGDCIPACPYDAIVMNKGQPLAPGIEPTDGAAEVPQRPAGVAEKCTFCVHRVDAGLQPACVTACPTDVISFGDLDDPDSAVAQKAERAGAFQPPPEVGADPSTYYLPPVTAQGQRRSGHPSV